MYEPGSHDARKLDFLLSVRVGAKLLLVVGALPTRHRLDALALPGRDQATQVHRRPAPLARVPELRQKRLYPRSNSASHCVSSSTFEPMETFVAD